MTVQTSNFRKSNDTKADRIVQTAGFVHDLEDTAMMRFRSTGDTPRMFMAFIAKGRLRDGVTDPSMNGITIVDIDNARVVATRVKSRPTHAGSVTPDQRFSLAILETLQWENFANYCRNAETYSSNIPDIDSGQVTPDSGNTANQSRLGSDFMLHLDIRNAFLFTLDQDPDVPYDFPQTTRDNAISEIMDHKRFRCEDGSFHLAFDIRMNFKWNTKGRVEDGEDVSYEYDSLWMRHYDETPEIFDRACEQALTPFLNPDYSVLEIGEEAYCRLDPAGGKSGFLAIREFGDQDMTFSSDKDLRDTLEELPVEDLVNLWTTIRVLDVDLSRQERGRLVAQELNEIRAEIESDWSRMHDQQSLSA